MVSAWRSCVLPSLAYYYPPVGHHPKSKFGLCINIFSTSRALQKCKYTKTQDSISTSQFREELVSAASDFCLELLTPTSRLWYHLYISTMADEDTIVAAAPQHHKRSYHTWTHEQRVCLYLLSHEFDHLNTAARAKVFNKIFETKLAACNIPYPGLKPGTTARSPT